jgi:catechol 2,3-dioxygenase-like lactoylglutathione lyase family enzyme
MKLEAVVIPVSKVDRAKEFYGNLGWRLDAYLAASLSKLGTLSLPITHPDTKNRNLGRRGYAC